MKRRQYLFAGALASASMAVSAQVTWDTPQAPFAVYGNTYYVGTRGISAVLITSDAGHILIDGASPNAPAQILQHIRQLGFKVEDIKYILNSHEHLDHAGGIATLQRWSGATVLSSPAGAAVLRSGVPSRADPQFSALAPMPPIANVRALRDGAVVELGALRVTAHFTPGHAPGGVSWTWTSSEGGASARMVYADSLNAIAAAPFQYSANRVYPQAKTDLLRSIATVAAMPCDILISAHPEGSDLWTRYDKAAAQGHTAFIDRAACRAYAGQAEARLAAALAAERARK